MDCKDAAPPPFQPTTQLIDPTRIDLMAAVSALPAIAASSLLTQHLYYDDTELFSSVGRVISQYAATKDGQEVLVLDQTVMHPQGGTVSI